MKLKFISLILISFVFSCNTSETRKPFVIEGKVLNVPSDKIFITNLRTGLIVDSTSYNGTEFLFNIIRKEELEDPFFASLYYKDNNGKMVPLFFESNNKKRSPTNGFMMEENPILIKGKAEKLGNLQLKGGVQNQVLDYSASISLFGFIPAKAKNRKAYINKYERIIKLYPESFFLLGQLYNYKELWSAEELNELLKNFTREVQNSSSTGELKEFIELRASAPKVMKDLIFEGEEGAKAKINFANSKIKILVLWASWCKPCRMEIPKLKAFYKEMDKNKIEMYSISIDENKDWWRRAMEVENMEWPQLSGVGEGEELSKNVKITKSIFNISAIPVIVITDDDGKVLGRIEGYDPDTNYQEIIKELL